ncbi:MAG: sugar phosphate isomerase/epimerase [Nitrososphaerota archaeon]|jgi:sugar phosphate isomerase/epimerase|uniref:sugar phosphate isomerase/epimerase family protein n=1 Tax=Candidatus Bathycorpusculum sp. TaxID=2994959 RepID=UPI002827A8A4|nr:sugar phosphate isomerase/epimerase [Candidatus Termitimicrobium sp.]MCL2432453.1 sugar phosphate isomerase/epimerase [Candidatus Termitimicrobium sp.]MDR0493889.1 sugar phosphate isomerase/epimerase [Nitrososphaerota archaeon]
MSRAKVGVSMFYCVGESFNRMVKRLGTMDTKYIELFDDAAHDLNKARILQLKEAAKSYGLTYSIHAPFSDVNIGSIIKPMLNASLKRLKQSLINASAIDAKMWVFHPAQRTGIGQFYPDADFKNMCRNIEMLFAQAEELGVNIALENMPGKYWFLMSTPEEFRRMYRETNLPVGITLDLGHANLEGQIQPFVDELADKIVHIHASNNQGSEDQHNGVDDGSIDYVAFIESLKKIGYDKTIIVESITNVPQSIARLKQLLA